MLDSLDSFECIEFMVLVCDVVLIMYVIVFELLRIYDICLVEEVL